MIIPTTLKSLPANSISDSSPGVGIFCYISHVHCISSNFEFYHGHDKCHVFDYYGLYYIPLKNITFLLFTFFKSRKLNEFINMYYMIWSL